MDYYNEIDSYVADWIENQILDGLIPDGKVDRRSIVDVEASDLVGFTQCHFFAGIAGWAHALRLAGWPRDREVWTASAPCQPFSHAGKQLAQADDRHLWPHFFRLLRARRPAVLFGEQVAAAIGLHWLDGVFADLESIDYARRAFVLPACAINAPHRRDRLYFVGRDQSPPSVEMAVWITVTTRDWKDTPGMALTRPDGRSRVDQLPRQVTAAVWATLTASGNSNVGFLPSAMKEAMRLHPQGRYTLMTQIAATLNPTPTASEHKYRLAGNSQQSKSLAAISIRTGRGAAQPTSSGTTEKLGGLNPQFACWLMGFPLAILNCAPSATPSSRTSQRK